MRRAKASFRSDQGAGCDVAIGSRVQEERPNDRDGNFKHMAVLEQAQGAMPTRRRACLTPNLRVIP